MQLAGQAAPNPPQMQKLLSKAGRQVSSHHSNPPSSERVCHQAKLQMEWQVQRQAKLLLGCCVASETTYSYIEPLFRALVFAHPAVRLQ